MFDISINLVFNLKTHLGALTRNLMGWNVIALSVKRMLHVVAEVVVMIALTNFYLLSVERIVHWGRDVATKDSRLKKFSRKNSGYDFWFSSNSNSRKHTFKCRILKTLQLKSLRPIIKDLVCVPLRIFQSK